LTRCEFNALAEASDRRLSGEYILRPVASTAAGASGTIAVCGSAECMRWPWGDLPQDKITWDGEWVTTGARPVSLQGTVNPDRIYPVDTVWLHGRGANQGLGAVLRIQDADHVVGWIFPWPSLPAGSLDGS
jgi:hypothetical protein